MSDLLIKNIKMPKSCGECKLAVNAYGSQTEGKCAVLGYGVTYLRKRHDACPLVALGCGGKQMSKYIKVDDLQEYCNNMKDHSITPNEFQRMNYIELPDEHGRLIDADANREDFMDTVYSELYSDGDNYRANRIIDAYDNAPTVLEANT